MTKFDPSRIFESQDRHSVDYLTIGAALSELNARLRGVNAVKLDIDPTDPKVLTNGASFTMDTDAGPLDFLNDVPGAADYNSFGARIRHFLWFAMQIQPVLGPDSDTSWKGMM